ncbi:MAG: hypothetical protein MI755_17910 [Sphingomonadales bacterium]|nr:hypothetical protein [Sphingomonadales bacterium]
MSEVEAAALPQRRRPLRLIGKITAVLALAGLTVFFGLLILIERQTGGGGLLYAAVIAVMLVHHGALAALAARWLFWGRAGGLWRPLLAALPAAWVFLPGLLWLTGA